MTTNGNRNQSETNSDAADLKKLRRELAAALRLAAKFELNEGICNHFSVAVPGKAERYLINPYGIHWAEMRPDDLLLIDGEGGILEGWGEVEASARNIHIAGHRANPNHAAILHVHSPHATALMMLDGGKLEMAHQTACRFLGRMAHQSFGGVAATYEEGERIAEAQKANPQADIIFLEHHGVSIGGPSVALAFDDLYYLERACRQQILAQSTGLPLKLMSDDQARDTARSWMQGMTYYADKHFAALMRIHGL
jgi:ribulose-5-phosphate 4-epimerase/fuculose-1-phosphate aldolase